MAYETNIDVYRFREIIQGFFKGLNLSDAQILERIEANRKDLHDYMLFTGQIEATLGVNDAFSSPSFEQILQCVRELKDKSDHKSTEAVNFRDRVKSIIGESFTDDEAISRIEHLEGFYSENLAFRANVLATLGNPNNAIAEIKRLQDSQGDGTKALTENLKQLLEQERSDSRNLCDQIDNLRHELRIANKVIARLVGE